LRKFVLNVKAIQMKLEVQDVLPAKEMVILRLNVKNVMEIVMTIAIMMEMGYVLSVVEKLNILV